MHSRHVIEGCCSAHSCSPWVLECVEPCWKFLLLRVVTILAGDTCLGITGPSSAMSAALPEGTGTCTNFTWKACVPVLVLCCTDTRSWLLTQCKLAPKRSRIAFCQGNPPWQPMTTQSWFPWHLEVCLESRLPGLWLHRHGWDHSLCAPV